MVRIHSGVLQLFTVIKVCITSFTICVYGAFFCLKMFMSLSMEEVISSVLALVGVWLTIRRSMWCWAALGISTILFGIVTLRGKLYADTALQVIYLATCIYGAWQWWRQSHTAASHESEITALTPHYRFIAIVFTLCAGALVGLFLDIYSDADIPYYDSLCFAMSVTAQILQAKKKIDNWLWWIMADSAYCLIYWYKGYYSFVILFIILTAMAYLGYREWKQQLSVI